jgi:ankyrin repeat protein
MEAVDSQHLHIVHYLLSHGAATDYSDKYGRTAVMIAIESRNLAILKVLLVYKSDVQLQMKKSKYSALHITCKIQLKGFTLQLLNYGANIHLLDSKRCTPLDYITDEVDKQHVIDAYSNYLQWKRKEAFVIFLYRADFRQCKSSGTNVSLPHKGFKSTSDTNRCFQNSLVTDLVASFL